MGLAALSLLGACGDGATHPSGTPRSSQSALALVDGIPLMQTDVDAIRAEARLAGSEVDEATAREQAIERLLVRRQAERLGVTIAESDLRTRLAAIREAAGGEEALAEALTAAGMTAGQLTVVTRAGLLRSALQDVMYADLKAGDARGQGVLPRESRRAVQPAGRGATAPDHAARQGVGAACGRGDREGDVLRGGRAPLQHGSGDTLRGRHGGLGLRALAPRRSAQGARPRAAWRRVSAGLVVREMAPLQGPRSARRRDRAVRAGLRADQGGAQRGASAPRLWTSGRGALARRPPSSLRADAGSSQRRLFCAPTGAAAILLTRDPAGRSLRCATPS